MRGQRKHFLPRVGSGIFKLELPPEQRREDSATLNRVEGGTEKSRKFMKLWTLWLVRALLVLLMEESSTTERVAELSKVKMKD